MPRKAKDIRAHRFNLNYANQDEARLHEHLLALAEEGQASAWVIQVLMRAIEEGTQQVHVGNTAGTRRVHAPIPNGSTSQVATYPVPKPSQANKRAGVRYEDVDEA